MRIIGAVCEDLLQSRDLAETHAQKMFGRRSEGSVDSGLMGSSRGSTWRERRQKGREDREREQEEEQSGLGEGSYQTNWAVSNA